MANPRNTTESDKSPKDSKAAIPNKLLMIEEIKKIAAEPYKDTKEYEEAVFQRLKKIYGGYKHVATDAMDFENRTPLIHAAMLGLPAVIKALYKLSEGKLNRKDPKVDHHDISSRTAVMYAVSYTDDDAKTDDPIILRRRETMDLLLQHKASTFYQGIFDFKSANKIKKIIPASHTRSNTNLTFCFACFYGNFNYIKKMVGNIAFSFETSPEYIALAAVNSYEDIIRYLIAMSNIEFGQDYYGKSNVVAALQYVVKDQNEKGVRALINAGLPMHLIAATVTSGKWTDVKDNDFLNAMLKKIKSEKKADAKEGTQSTSSQPLSLPAYNPGVVPPPPTASVSSANIIGNLAPSANAPDLPSDPPPYSDAAVPVSNAPIPMNLAGGNQKDKKVAIASPLESNPTPLYSEVPVSNAPISMNLAGGDQKDNKVVIPHTKANEAPPAASGLRDHSLYASQQPIPPSVARGQYSKKLRGLLKMLEGAEEFDDPELLSQTEISVGKEMVKMGVQMQALAPAINKRKDDKDDKTPPRPPSA